ncbi:MAG: flagella basal body P-ring formation protein FlgA [SAR324 cluster bacterium]|nr:flagella basal body P-ring formation protein FlgA [SAR324 cluster bacterium]
MMMMSRQSRQNFCFSRYLILGSALALIISTTFYSRVVTAQVVNNSQLDDYISTFEKINSKSGLGESGSLVNNLKKALITKKANPPKKLPILTASLRLPQPKKAPINKKPIVYATISDQVEIENKRLLAKHILSIKIGDYKVKQKIENYRLGLSPKAGKEMILSKKEILSRLKMGFPLYDFKLYGADKISIKRVSALLTKESQIKIINNFAQTQLDEKSTSFKILTTLKDIYLPVTNPSYKLTSLDNDTGGIFRNWSLNLFDSNDTLIKKIAIRGKIVANDFYSRQASSKNIIKEISSTKSSTRKNKSPKMIADEVNHLFHQVAMKEKERLTPAPSLKKINTNQNSPLVKKGAMLTLVYDSKFFQLKTLVTALEGGNIGDIIRVKNKTTNKPLMGKVLSASTISVAVN